MKQDGLQKNNKGKYQFVDMKEDEFGHNLPVQRYPTNPTKSLDYSPKKVQSVSTEKVTIYKCNIAQVLDVFGECTLKLNGIVSPSH